MQMRTAYQEDTKKEKEDDEDREKEEEEEDLGGFPFPLHQFGVFFLFFFSSIPSEAIIYVDAVSLAASPFPFFSARFSLENFCFKERGNKMSITIRERTICYLFPLHSAFLCASWSALLRLVLRHAASRDFILELSFFLKLKTVATLYVGWHFDGCPLLFFLYLLFFIRFFFLSSRSHSISIMTRPIFFSSALKFRRRCWRCLHCVCPFIFYIF